jgi:hypothetical protein
VSDFDKRLQDVLRPPASSMSSTPKASESYAVKLFPKNREILRQVVAEGLLKSINVQLLGGAGRVSTSDKAVSRVTSTALTLSQHLTITSQFQRHTSSGNAMVLSSGSQLALWMRAYSEYFNEAFARAGASLRMHFFPISAFQAEAFMLRLAQQWIRPLSSG